MIDIALQIQGDYSLHPFSGEDLEKLKEYKPNQVVRGKIIGVRKQRSYRQLKAYWAACQTTASNNESPGWQTKDQVDFQLRVAVRFYDPKLIIALPDGSIAFNYRSISYKNLKHIEACGYFSEAFNLMADKLGCTVEDLIKAE